MHINYRKNKKFKIMTTLVIYHGNGRHGLKY